MEYSNLDSFVIYICIEGELSIDYKQGTLKIKKGDSVLLPALFKSFWLSPSSDSKVLEVYVP